ncbi:hypothetical protein EWM64_g7099, partial [Hericium alpestre]
EDPVVIDIDSDSEPESLGSPVSSIHGLPVKDDVKDEPDLSKKLVKKRSASPAVAPTDDVGNKPLKLEDMMPPPPKRPRTKVEVVIDGPHYGRRKSRESRRVSSVNASVPPRDDDNSMRLPATVKSEEPANADDRMNVDTRSEMNEHVYNNSEEAENLVLKQEPELTTVAGAEADPIVKNEDEEQAILASAAATLLMLPKPELKKGLDFDAATLQSRIDAIGRDPYPTTLDPILRATWVSRQPGLWFHSERTIGNSIKEERTFVRLRSAEWLYMGQYRMDAAEPLTQAEWMMQSDKVRKKWAQEILSEGYGQSVRFRVIFRRELGRDPTEEEEQGGLMVNDPFINLTWEEIRSAYDSGKERMGIDTMKCVGCDEKFQRDIATQFPNWVPPPSKKALKAKESKNQEQKPKKPKKSKARKEEFVESEAEGYPNHWSEGEGDRLDDQAAEASMSYVSRGTKSRPSGA